MDYLKNMQNAIDFIERNLKESLTVKIIAREAYLSMYHFHRIFTAFTGETLGDYIRKRRLTEASYMLRKTDRRIIDIAFEFRFESQEAFTRAFKKNFRITPAKYRKEKREFRIFERKVLTQDSLEHFAGGITLEPQITKKEAFTVVGMRCTTSIKNNTIPDLWRSFLPRMDEIKNKISPEIALGVCEIGQDLKLEDLHEENEFSELVCIEVSSDRDIPRDMVSSQIPAQTYAVFTHKGTTGTLQTTYDYIYGTWLLKSDYELTLNYNFELYDTSRFFGIDNIESEIDIYVPIRKV